MTALVGDTLLQQPIDWGGKEDPATTLMAFLVHRSGTTRRTGIGQTGVASTAMRAV